MFVNHHVWLPPGDSLMDGLWFSAVLPGDDGTFSYLPAGSYVVRVENRVLADGIPQPDLQDTVFIR